MTEDENKLIAKARNGDRTALSALITGYWPYIYRLAFTKTGKHEDAQEITQETFLKALAALPRYQQTNAAFKTYLSRITLNLTIDYYRKHGRAPQAVDIADCNKALVDPRIRPEEAVIGAEWREEVARLLMLLPDEQRQVIELRIIQGLAVADVAHLMGKSGAAVKMMQQRALKKLKQLFSENGIMGGEVGAG